MAKEMKDVQQLINDKADARLKQDVTTLANYVWNGVAYKLLEGMTVNVGSVEKPKNIALSSIFNQDGFYSQIVENNKEAYRTEETKLFIEKVESLREDVDNLLNNQNY